jgi:hypothetical protein
MHVKMKVKGMVQLITPYFPHSFHCQVSNVQCLSMQHAQYFHNLHVLYEI